MRRPLRFRLLSAAALLSAAVVSPRAPAARADEKGKSFDERFAQVLPRPDEERWLQIAWRSSLAEGRREASTRGRPLFLWLMDGDPLGCT